MYFNPLPPHGGRLALLFSYRSARSFQSTPSAWRETSVVSDRSTAPRHFNPLPPHGGRLLVRRPNIHLPHFNPLPPHGGRLLYFTMPFTAQLISIHSLRMEGDQSILLRITSSGSFQSTPSAWRETQSFEFFRRYLGISIHSLRMEGDNGRGFRITLICISIHSLRMEGDRPP